MKSRAMTRIMQFYIVLVVMVSVFFYAPMDVSAEELDVGVSDIMDWSLDNSIDLEGSYYQLRVGTTSSTFNFDDHIAESLVDENIYKVKFNTTAYLNSNNTGYVQQFVVRLGTDFSLLFNSSVYLNANNQNSMNLSSTKEYYLTGAQLKENYSLNISYIYRRNTDATVNVAGTVGLDLISVESVVDPFASDYQNGYDAGYSAGEAQGFNSGYQSGLDAGYDSGFEEGKNSVDTNSYYQAGYSAGYDAAYSVGFEEGYDRGYALAYDDGYQSAMDRIDGWGADTSDYPIRLAGLDYEERTFRITVKGWEPFKYESYGRYRLNFDINPNHTYMFSIDVKAPEFSGDDVFLLESSPFYLDVGGISYLITSYNSVTNYRVFVPGDRMTNSFSYVWRPIASLYGTETGGNDGPSGSASMTLSTGLGIYDMGPAGDTQNHIANQTDQLTNGYDSSQGAAVNDDFKASVNEYHTAEDSLFSTATSSLENFTFLDFTSITGMVTSLSFVSSIMTSIYMAMGGNTGASGIILAVLFSVMLVSMAIGLYRYYVSNGKSDGSGKGGD